MSDELKLMEKGLSTIRKEIREVWQRMVLLQNEIAEWGNIAAEYKNGLDNLEILFTEALEQLTQRESESYIMLTKLFEMLTQFFAKIDEHGIQQKIKKLVAEAEKETDATGYV